MAGYYRKFCINFSVIAEPLTNLLSKRMRFKWTSDRQNAFDKLKAILRSEPFLLAPNFNKEFKLAVDASDVGAGDVLLQEDDNGVDHPVCYFYKKFNKHQKNRSFMYFRIKVASGPRLKLALNPRYNLFY